MIFLDTGFLFALVSKRDAHHPRVVAVFRTFKDLRLVDHLLTTNHVIAETITLTRKIGHEDAARTVYWTAATRSTAGYDVTVT